MTPLQRSLALAATLKEKSIEAPKLISIQTISIYQKIFSIYFVFCFIFIV